jgi:glycosyltransferase involved in cell wall biosynthesis
MITPSGQDESEDPRSQDPPRFLGSEGEYVVTPAEAASRLSAVIPLKVCRVITRLNVGGPSVQATLLSAELAPPQFESVLLAGVEAEREGNYLDLLDRKQRERIDVKTLRTLGRSPHLGDDARTLAELVNIFRRLRPDIVHTHMAKAGTLGRIAAKLTGVPIVVHTFHGNVFKGYFSRPVSIAVARWETALASLSDAVVAISPSQVAELTEVGIPRQKIRVIPLGIPLQRFEKLPSRQESRSQLEIPETAICIGWVARLVPIKNPELMVEAAAVVASEVGKTVLVIAGDGPLREQVENKAARLGVDLRILGWQSDLSRFYAACDVVALSSRNEGFPVALIEAIASGIPVAATDVGGVADLFGAAGQGELADTNTPRGLAAAIERALEIPRAQLEVSARRVRDSYGAQRLVSDITQLYQELALSKLGKIEKRRKLRS